MSDGYLTRAYTARDPESTRKLYDDWADSYEAEIAENGYATPRRCAEALAAQMDDLAAPILDFGCGTGLSGLALKLAGFQTIDGVDLSAEMLQQARHKGIYRNLDVIEPGATPPQPPGGYAAICAIGVIGAGAAPLSVFDTLVAALAPGSRFVFSFNDHTLEDPQYEARLNRYLDTGRATLLFREHGAHLPGIGLDAYVYVIART